MPPNKQFVNNPQNPGAKGDTGEPGKSAWQIAQENGWTGTVQQWLASLKGEKGDKGLQGNAGTNGINGTNGIDASAPAGGILLFAGILAPKGYLLCDGASYLRSSYPALLTAIGTVFGFVDATHFNVPKIKGIVNDGKDKTTLNYIIKI